MATCQISSKPTGWLASLKGVSHTQCERNPILQQIEAGEFKSCDSQAVILLEQGEHCLAIVTGCEMADLPPSRFDALRGADEDQGWEDGWGVAEAATATRTRKPEGGTLHVTDRRICFIGGFHARTIPLSKVVEVRYANDTLKIVAEGSQCASYSIPETPRRLEIAAAVITKLQQLAHSNKRPKVRKELRQINVWDQASAMS